jgi:hypothetical protein
MLRIFARKNRCLVADANTGTPLAKGPGGLQILRRTGPPRAAVEKNRTLDNPRLDRKVHSSAPRTGADERRCTRFRPWLCRVVDRLDVDTMTRENASGEKRDVKWPLVSSRERSAKRGVLACVVHRLRVWRAGFGNWAMSGRLNRS